MFEVGKTYTLHFIEDGGSSYHSAKVLDWQPPLLKVDSPGKEYVIYNTSSQIFNRAEPLETSHSLFEADELLNKLQSL